MYDLNEGVGGFNAAIDFKKRLLSSFDIRAPNSLTGSVASLDPEVVLSTTCVVLTAASNVSSMKFPDWTMYKVLASLKRIEGNLKTILETPLKKAIDTFDFILDAVVFGKFESAYEKLEKLIDNAETAFHYADGNEGKLSIVSYRECAKATRLLMFGHLLKESYDKSQKAFVTPDNLQPTEVALIGTTLERIVRKCVDQKKNVKTTSWGIERNAKKSDAQDILDSILKFAYPYISRAKNLTGMNEMRFSSHHQFCLLSDILPMGYEDATQLTLGYTVGSDGTKAIVKVNVWREKTSVWCEYKKIQSNVDITPESKEIKMEVMTMVPCFGPLTLEATGRAVKIWPSCFGDYSLMEEEPKFNGRPVYRLKEGWPLYIQDDGTWAVSDTLGQGSPRMKSTTAANCPALC